MNRQTLEMLIAGVSGDWEEIYDELQHHGEVNVLPRGFALTDRDEGGLFTIYLETTKPDWLGRREAFVIKVVDGNPDLPSREQRAYMGCYKSYLQVSRDDAVSPELKEKVLNMYIKELKRTRLAWRSAGATDKDVFSAQLAVIQMLEDGIC